MSMEALVLLTLSLALVIVLAVFRRDTPSSRHGRTTTVVKISDPAAARRMLIEHADAFSNRPSSPFPVPLITGRRQRSQSHGITTVPYGPHWRALRRNLNAAILHPWRLGALAPLQRDAVDALVASLLRTRGGGDADAMVVARDHLYPAVFSLLARVCFGDGVGVGHLLAMQRMMQEFRVAIGEVRALASSRVAKLLHWRRWRRFLAFRGQQVALFRPLIAEKRRLRSSSSSSLSSSPGGTRPCYVDSLIDLQVPAGGNDDDAQTTGGSRSRALTDDEIVSLVVEFLGAAESIVACVEWTLAHLVTQPEIQRKLRREVSGDGGDGGSFSDDGDRLGKAPYLHAVVLESLRLHPPFPLTIRHVVEVTVAGAAATPAASASKVCFMLKKIARDGKAWSEPDEFRPERFLAGGEGETVGPVPGTKDEIIRMMPFGAGQRSCPGAGLGMLYIKCFLSALLREFEWAPPPAVERRGGVDMTELFGFITVMKTPLQATITRSASPR